MRIDPAPRTTPEPNHFHRRVAILFHESETLGAGLSLLRVADELRQLGWVLAGWFPGAGPLPAEHAAAFAGLGQREKPIAFSLRGWRRPPGLRRRAADTPAYLRAVDLWLREVRPHVVHANSLQMLPEATVARRQRLPVVVQVHELPAPSAKRALTLRWAAAAGDVLVGVSDAVTTMLCTHAGRTPVLTVRNGVRAVGERTEEPSSFVVGTVGYVSRTKGTDIFLRAAELALRARPGLRFEHVGAARLWGDEEFDDEIEELARSPSLRSALAMLGPASVSAALARWSLFVLASRQEAFPLSTLEAMASGVPVVAADVGGVPEQIVHLETGVLVRPEDPQAIAEWIVRLHDDVGLRRLLGAAGRAHARRTFTLAAQAEGLASAYELALRTSAVRETGLRNRRRSST